VSSGALLTLLQWCQWLESTDLATSIRESAYLYPFIEGSHVLGLALSVGTVIWFDLRLIGVSFRRESVSLLFAQLRPWILIGFAIMFVTGGLLFAARAGEVFSSVYFRVKLGLLLLGGLNVLVFHGTIDRRRDEWDSAPRPPLQVRIAGGLSLLLWFAIIAAGRVMAYNL
jgi:hypothetical protein